MNSTAEAARKLQIEGYNELPDAKRLVGLKLVLTILREPMILLLVCCASVYFVLGEPKDGLLLSFSVFVVMGMTLYQEWKSEKALAALKDLSSPRARVIRDGREMTIAGREIVSGDIVLISEGDRVPADATLVTSQHLKVDESLLTGESFSVTKDAGAPLFSGTLIVSGRGEAQVIATGPRTQIGKIGQSLNDPRKENQTLLQKELSRLIRVFALLGLVFSFFIVLVYGITRHDWPHGLLIGLATAMSLLPEEFPVVLTVFLALGAWRISKVNVLTRKLSATENLGSITVLCVDKTGTLTQNRMAIRELDVIGAQETTDTLIEYGAMASPMNAFDPMDQAIRNACKASHPDWKLIREYPLSHNLLAMTFAWSRPQSHQTILATKGAPEAVAALCRLSPGERQKVLDRVKAFADRGLRVLGVARSLHEGELYDDVQDYKFEFVGLIALEDPIRPEVPAAVQECYGAGIRVIMMTGDYPGTAKSIAEQIGFKNPNDIITGPELRDLSDLQLQERIKSVNVFARMIPEQKVRVINALKSRAEVVAMTGDGVNDAPSLKWADVGIAMGGRGTDVAREAASIVLLDDNFTSVVAAIRLGRRIFDNIRKATSFIFAVHVPIAGMAMLPVLLKMPLVLFPAHIVFLELVIDPASAILFESEAAEPNIMRRPPRSLDKPLFGASEILANLLTGLTALVFVFLVFWFAGSLGWTEGLTRTVTFSALVFSNLALILLNRSKSSGLLQTIHVRNNTFVYLVSGTLLFLAVLIFVPAAQAVFHFEAINLSGFALACGAGWLTVLTGQFQKRLWGSVSH